MRILAYNAAHDGAAALIENGHLKYSLESEKDSRPRYAPVDPLLFLTSLQLTEPPDIVALDAIPKLGGVLAQERVVDNASLIHAFMEWNYFDETPAAKTDCESIFAGQKVRRFSSSHVRCHIMCSYGLSPLPQGQPCYVLVWEGVIGSMYHVDENVVIRKIGDVLINPGRRYVFLYALADPTVAISERNWERLENAGKLMALAAYGRRGSATSEQQELVDTLMSFDAYRLSWFNSIPPKSAFVGNRFYNIGVEAQEFRDVSWQLSEAVFDRFHQFAKEHVKQKLPLLIAGGCGLNCEWNTKWIESRLFTDVFVPPCTNDSGIAIGAAIDALQHYTGQAKIEWSVYAGAAFNEDTTDWPDFDCSDLNLEVVCRCLLRGDVIAWVQGRYEMGPRALGNRSLLAAPFLAETRDRLNRIKQREPFRPIAPICLEEDLGRHFEHAGPSPHMLYFQRVKNAALKAITHVDGSARVQTVKDAENPAICDLLREFREQSGVAVLCNTSLNFRGRGFINRLSHLLIYARERGVDGVAVGTRFWSLRKQAST